MIRTIATNSTHWMSQLPKCLPPSIPSISKTHAVFTRTFSAKTPIQNPIIQNNALLHAMALKIAVSRGNLKQVQSVLRDEPDVNHEYNDGFSILHYAVKALHSGMVKELLLAGADINKQTRKEGNTPLHIACTLDYKLVAEELLRAKPNLNGRNQAGNTPLEEAILAQSSDCCKLLYDAGANINEQNPTSGRTPFMLACEIRAFNLTELLLILGANPHLNIASL